MSGSNSSTSKGNGASKRMSNPKLKAKRARCWLNGQKRKEARRKAAAEAQARNDALRAQGLPTPWEQTKLARLARRATSL